MIRRFHAIEWLLAALLLLPAIVEAQGLAIGPKLEAKPYLSVDAAPQGSEFQLAVVVEVPKPYHINAHVVKDSYLIPTTLTVTAPSSLSAGAVVYPPSRTVTVAGKPLDVYQGRTTLRVPFQVEASVLPGELQIEATLRYQACSDKNCFPPKDAVIAVPVKVVAKGQPSQPINADVFGAASTAAATTSPPAPGGSAPATSNNPFDVATILREHGWLFALGLIFLGGLSINLTPCVYPLIPVTIAYFGGQAQGAGSKRQRTFALALFYVLGIAVTYSTLGVVAALAGKTIGFVFQSPVVPVVVALIIAALALNMFGLYEIRPPAFIANNARGRSGPLGAMIMGLIVGFVAAPCIAAPVSALVVFVATTRNPFIGFSLFFTLALGLGTPYLILGAFTGAASALPKSGAWTEMVKRVFGVLMLGAAFYFLKSLLPSGVFDVLFPAYVLAAGVYLIFGEHELAVNRRIIAFKTITGLASAVWAVSMLVGVGLSKGAGRLETVQWQPYSASALATAKEAHKPVLIDFYATWCMPCKELDEKTFQDPRVASALKEFVAIKADLTRGSDPVVKGLYQRFQITGVPTILFLGPDGEEKRAQRLEGFEPPDQFVKRVSGATASGSGSVAELPR